MTRRVLLVEDEPGLVMTLTDRLSEEGYEVEAAGNGRIALERTAAQPFDVILLDVMLPFSSGFDVCQDLRRRGVRTPVLMLTAKSQVVDKVVGLKLGADDYMTKPFEMIELLARIEALLRRASGSDNEPSPDGRFQFGDVLVDFRTTEVFRSGQPLKLSATRIQASALLRRKYRDHVLARPTAELCVGLRRRGLYSHGRCSRGLASPQNRIGREASETHPNRARLRLPIRRLSLFDLKSDEDRTP